MSFRHLLNHVGKSTAKLQKIFGKKIICSVFEYFKNRDSFFFQYIFLCLRSTKSTQHKIPYLPNSTTTIKSMEKIELSILGLTVSQSPDSYIILLKDKQGNKRLPIIVGSGEAQSIAVAIDNLHPPRPLTHDAFFNIMTHFGIELKEVYIYDIIKGVFYAQMICEKHAGIHSFEVRSSDAIAMALRFNVPIYTNENVLKIAGVEPASELPNGQTKQKKLIDMSPDELQQAIDNAVKTEDYETASLLRDLLKKKINPLSSI